MQNLSKRPFIFALSLALSIPCVSFGAASLWGSLGGRIYQHICRSLLEEGNSLDIDFVKNTNGDIKVIDEHARTISLREFLKDETLLKFIYDNPHLVNHWKILGILGKHLRFVLIRDGNGVAIIGRGRTAFGYTMFAAAAGSNKQDGVVIGVAHNDLRDAQEFRNRVKATVENIPGQANGQYSIGIDTGNRTIEGKGTLSTMIFLSDKNSYQNNSDFFVSLYSKYL